VTFGDGFISRSGADFNAPLFRAVAFSELCIAPGPKQATGRGGSGTVFAFAGGKDGSSPDKSPLAYRAHVNPRWNSSPKSPRD
jgi:hypothetical protein